MASWVSVLLAPVAGVVMIMVATWVGSRAGGGAGDLPSSLSSLASITFLLAITLFGLAPLAEQHADRLERLLVDAKPEALTGAFPVADRSVRDASEDPLVPTLAGQVRYALDDARRRPSLVTRQVCTATAAVFHVTALGAVGWQAYLGHGKPSATGVATSCAVSVLFWIAWLDLRSGHTRRLTRPFHRRRWLTYEPLRAATVVPTAPVLILVLVPFVLTYVVFTADSSWTVRATAVAAALVAWDLVAKGRTAANSSSMQRLERLFQPLTSAITTMVRPAWWAARVGYVVAGIVALALIGIDLSAPAGKNDETRSPGLLGFSLAGSHMMCGFVIWQWPRPTTVQPHRPANSWSALVP